ncbi:hypothetical protein EMPS_03778 [Entomortierella parvispora]|uniref:Uncharacterized protein n=1 Tax=Entomortierella parvispora TaxID=205924 RepID=A0A9P3H7W5_9FUNG|nr:hypothetical protein EMPS_03778 [Entomortierella parvispora]
MLHGPIYYTTIARKEQSSKATQPIARARTYGSGTCCCVGDHALKNRASAEILELAEEYARQVAFVGIVSDGVHEDK